MFSSYTGFSLECIFVDIYLSAFSEMCTVSFFFLLQFIVLGDSALNLEGYLFLFVSLWVFFLMVI